MKLTRALKEKNRLIKKITILRNQITTSNVVLEENNFPYEMETLQEDFQTLVETLIELKVDIQIANQPILKSIYRLSELKSTIAMLEGMDTKEGMQEAYGYGNSELRAYKAQIGRQEVDIAVAEMQEQIDTLQDEVDTFNATTTVDFVLPE